MNQNRHDFPVFFGNERFGSAQSPNQNTKQKSNIKHLQVGLKKRVMFISPLVSSSLEKMFGNWGKGAVLESFDAHSAASMPHLVRRITSQRITWTVQVVALRFTVPRIPPLKRGAMYILNGIVLCCPSSKIPVSWFASLNTEFVGRCWPSIILEYLGLAFRQVSGSCRHLLCEKDADLGTAGFLQVCFCWDAKIQRICSRV